MSRVNYTDKQLRAMFGKPIQPTIPISLEQISTEAQKLAGKLSISGVQPKLSVRLEGDRLQPVAKDGQYILKPQTQQFAELPQNEYLCMQMGRKFGLNTAESILLELSDGTPKVEFRPIQLARHFFDLAPIQAAGLSTDELNIAISERIDGMQEGVADQVTRQVVYDVQRAVSRDLDHAAVREIKARALHYQLDLRRPPPTGPVGIAAEAKRQTLRDLLVDYLGRRPLEASIDRRELVALANTYMDRVDHIDERA